MIGSVAAWGRRHGISREAARKRVADHQIPKTADGKIDFEEADRIWNASLNPLQQQRGATQATKKETPDAAKTTAPQAKQTRAAEPSRMGTAQILHEEAKARKAAIEADRLQGKLIEIDKVEADWCDIATRVRDGLMGLAAKICTHLPAEWRRDVTAAVDQEVRHILAALSNEISSNQKAA